MLTNRGMVSKIIIAAGDRSLCIQDCRRTRRHRLATRIKLVNGITN
ncbi:hypothetical protein H6G91_37945 [Nostoc muscorum FACHB-395]|nr:hypothetical protein [Desmonostoc muscorum FACHB-395]